MYKNEKLDEMQIQRRNKIGNNCFMAMFYLLFIDIGLREIGISWLAYPLNVLIIITICMVYYLIGTIKSGSYLGVNYKNENSKYVIGGIFVSVFLLISGIVLTVFFKDNNPLFSNIGTTLIVITISILVFLVIVALGNISRHKNDNGEN
ncbi:hypothetical protein LL037_06830 [Clostridium estertheticum]|uniref:Uncharacterized protein n=1 Tax=Clostridium estertheticum TaxID=238834 RepID=A0AA47I4C9_9CLOT|nr:DUF6773 family protein [Clostridium estertheticum]MBU3155755.1 hypothetical protein [Clostridium estertheticum]MBU3201160.1 hypothetical protein [Clostridium estertheticum]WAG59107.1 hypothetical protein LL038_15850 [Clostridium estertheticum]WAG66842.1 hypothetical protein LL037_06830 [Clostridium estertheticum]